MSNFDPAEVFGDDYFYFYEPLLTAERSDREADRIFRLAELTPGARVLDVPCGHGRIANRLAAMGCQVVGVDTSDWFLEMAATDAQHLGVTVDYRNGDMRALDFDSEFDLVINWFTSFGFFDDATDRAILSSWYRALRPGGRLLIEHLNRDWLVPRIVNQSEGLLAMRKRGQDLLIDRWSFDLNSGRSLTERTTVRDGRTSQHSFSVRLFAVPELRDWMAAAGFRLVRALGSGDHDLSPSDSRMTVLAAR